jgi:transcriptional regulator with XRE-family HTH domain
MSDAPTREQLADALGVAPTLVSRYRNRGMPVHSIDAALAWKAENVRARAGGKPTAGKGGAGGDKPDATGYGDHRARREKAEADRAEILAMREHERTLLREPAERAVFDAFRGLRDAAFQAMRDAAPTVRDLTEPREIQLALEDALRQAFLSFESAMVTRLDDLAKEARP